jgi:hypothetical protein
MTIGAFLPLIGKVMDLVFPDPTKAAEAKLKAAELAQKGELAFLDADLKLALAQIEVNKIEAADPSLFKSGWRPATGWLCVAGLGYTFLLRPLLPWLVQLTGANVPALPPIDIGELMVLLGGLLGLGGMRTAEKLRSKA